MQSIPEEIEEPPADYPVKYLKVVNHDVGVIEVEEGGNAGDVQINVEEYLLAARRPLEVTRKNKVICTIAFVVLIIAIGGYVTGLALIHVKSDIMEDLHFKSPTDIIYFLMMSDVVASVVGIWTCLKKTGPQPMIYACIWLLLSSLINLCVAISLTFETKTFREEKNKHCRKGNTSSEECKIYGRVSIVLWCSLLTIAPKFLAIFLCRLNYPKVFNWMMGKDVYVDEELLPHANTGILTNAGSLAATYFDPVDVRRLAARGSLDGAVISGNTEDSPAIFVTRDDTKLGNPEISETEINVAIQRKYSKKGSIYVEL